MVSVMLGKTLVAQVDPKFSLCEHMHLITCDLLLYDFM